MDSQAPGFVGIAIVVSGILAVVTLGLIVRYAFFKPVEGKDSEAQKFYRDFYWWCLKLAIIVVTAFIFLFTGGLDKSWFGAGIAGIIIYTLMGIYMRIAAWKKFKGTDR